MILVFLGSWRSTVIIAVSIPLSILSSIIVLSALGETINIMTLGGLALAVGMLVDDATVAIENINWHLEQGKDLEPAILDGSDQIAIPAFVSTICICIVFVPMFFLTGVARYLFVPMAEAVVFAMLASYVLSRTLVPTMAKYLLHAHEPHGVGSPSRNPFVRIQRAIDRGFVRMRDGYRALLERCVRDAAFHRPVSRLCLSSLLLAALGRPGLLSGGRRRTVQTAPSRRQRHAHRGDRASSRTTSRTRCARSSRRESSPSIIDNIGLPYSGLNLSYSTSAPIGPGDADIMVSLGKGSPADGGIHPRPARRAAEAVSRRDVLVRPGRHRHADPELRPAGADRHPDCRTGHRRRTARSPGRLLAKLRAGAGHRRPARAAGIQSAALHLDVDRTRAAQLGLTQRDVANNLLISLSGSSQTTPTCWLNPATGVSYAVATHDAAYRSIRCRTSGTSR